MAREAVAGRPGRFVGVGSASRGLLVVSVVLAGAVSLVSGCRVKARRSRSHATPQDGLDAVAGSGTMEREEDCYVQHHRPRSQMSQPDKGSQRVWPGLRRAGLRQSPAREPGQRRRRRRA